ncbi:hypothetical protein [Massilia psychrophila]|uniref:DUF2946 domain-containing protein n=1 Tax=Massilia psychrophila TaxID=1603353 RepID=A0A2G8SZ24_9BURK|nr:hypothetical protein [Massilia psychrophila]PIL39011.1 hypothetical protein CR103_15150 [Massilia psychrophila]GGE89182.1 hypothetical protein GCM10008020_37760 [Massilia psychrophila]
MKNLFNSVLVWCMLLAVPLQGYAFATTLLCAPLGTASRTMGPHAPAPAHDHQAMLLAVRADIAHAAGADMSANHAETSDTASPNHDAGGQCNACSACCLGAAMAVAHTMRMPVEAQQLTVVPFDLLFTPAVDLALPERPPQASLT